MISFLVFVALTPIYIYYSYLLGLNSNSDAAVNVLEAWDMTHGRPLLQGWVQGNNSYMTNELLLYALVAAVIGVTPWVIFISQGILYAALVVLTGLLAVNHLRDRGRALLAAALVGAMLLAVTRETTGWMMLSLIDHLTTAIPLLILLLVLDRATILSWRHGLAAFAILTWAITSDHLAVYVGVLPLVLVAGARAYLHRTQRAGHLALVVGAVASLGADYLFKAGVEALGGAARNTPPEPVFASVQEMSANVWETLNGIMVIFGAGLFGRGATSSKDEILHLAVLAVAVAGWVIAIRSLRTLRLVDQVLITAIVVNIAAFLASPMPGPSYTAHELLVVVPFSVALAARLITPRLTTRRARMPVYVGFGLAVVVLAATLTGPRVVDPERDVIAWLKERNLTYGLAGFWQAASITVITQDTVRVRAIINDGRQKVGPFTQARRADWYDPARNDARFVISHSGADGSRSIYDLNEKLLEGFFGPATVTHATGPYRIHVYDHNLLPKLLTVAELPTRYQYPPPR